jgi:hypothetical protein
VLILFVTELGINDNVNPEVGVKRATRKMIVETMAALSVKPDLLWRDLLWRDLLALPHKNKFQQSHNSVETVETNYFVRCTVGVGVIVIVRILKLVCPSAQLDCQNGTASDLTLLIVSLFYC